MDRNVSKSGIINTSLKKRQVQTNSKVTKDSDSNSAKDEEISTLKTSVDKDSNNKVGTSAEETVNIRLRNSIEDKNRSNDKTDKKPITNDLSKVSSAKENVKTKKRQVD